MKNRLELNLSFYLSDFLGHFLFHGDHFFGVVIATSRAHMMISFLGSAVGTCHHRRAFHQLDACAIGKCFVTSSGTGFGLFTLRYWMFHLEKN